MKKLLAIAPYNYLPWFSGGQKSIAQFLEYLGRESDLTVISVAENDFSLAKNYKPLPLLKRSFNRYIDMNLVSKITTLVKKEKFDAVIWEHPYYAWLASLVKKRTGIETIIHTHNIEYQRFHTTGRWWWPILKMYEEWSFKMADHLLFVAPEDKCFAIRKWKINEKKCIEVAFGIEIKEYPGDKNECKQKIHSAHHINQQEKILFFNGLLDYKPNLDALKIILDEINPLLLAQPSFQYKIIICGKRLPKELNELKEYAGKNIIYAGYVDDIEMYFKGADLFLNPVQTGGGVKTKMVESIAFGTTVIATETAAAGIKREICGNKLIVVPDNEWKVFAKTVIQIADKNETTPPSYYEYYYWGNIVKKLLKQLPD
jgi:hypothetical protein